MLKSTSFGGRSGAAAVVVLGALVSLPWTHPHVHGDVAVEVGRLNNDSRVC